MACQDQKESTSLPPPMAIYLLTLFLSDTKSTLPIQTWEQELLLFGCGVCVFVCVFQIKNLHWVTMQWREPHNCQRDKRAIIAQVHIGGKRSWGSSRKAEMEGGWHGKSMEGQQDSSFLPARSYKFSWHRWWRSHNMTVCPKRFL